MPARRRAAILALGTVLLLTGCSSATVQAGSSSESSTSSAASTAAVSDTTSAAAGATTTITATATGTHYTVTAETPFQTPTGNIGCAVGPDGVRCDISAHSFSAGKQPSTCDGDWGDSITLEASGAAILTCHGDTVLQQGRVLHYGDSMTAGVYTCTSTTAGVACEDSTRKHGFSLAKAAYRLY